MNSAVAVVIPCRNEAATIRSVLDALLDQDRQANEVVIVDDGSSDGTEAVVQEWLAANPRVCVRIVRTAGQGAGAAMNAGIRQSRSDVIVRLDGHCRPRCDYIHRSVDALADARVVPARRHEVRQTSS